MIDPRVTRLAELLCDHSTALGPDDRVLVHGIDVPGEAVAEVVRIAQSRGAKVMVKLYSNRIHRRLLEGMTEEGARLVADIELYEMKQMTAYISLRGSNNVAETSGLPTEKLQMWQQLHATPVHMEQRVPYTKWVALRWPTPSMAQQAMMGTDAFEDFYFKVCTMDYKKMAQAVKPLEDLMNRTDHVHIKGPGTDLTFSIKDIGSKPCYGLRNIPDGECFSCPVRDSVNGTISFNTVSLYQGTEFKDIRYALKDGKIIEATAGDQTERLNQILDTDEGARYIGEWSLGFNPYVLHPMKDTLFDEKIAGSFHFTPGNAYPPPGGNGNKSAIHWDTVMIQRPEYGGGEIWFDGVLIRKDGIFLLPELSGLNPDQLA
ncbi:MAG: aminopeptidase [Fimbriimonadaceae bacterium]|nr:aminopeptidase [Fimbriimonadaceae bacterium]QYK58305.1 MAG: aminopeptidase [Fimbriimonadaceae bacterium]